MIDEQDGDPVSESDHHIDLAGDRAEAFEREELDAGVIGVADHQKLETFVETDVVDWIGVT